MPSKRRGRVAWSSIHGRGSVARERDALPRQNCRPHQKSIDGVRGLAALADRPDDEGLAAPHVAAGKDLWNRRFVAHLIGLDVSARERDAEIFQKPLMLRRNEAHGKEDEIGPELEGAVWDFLKIRIEPHADEFLHGAILAAQFLGQNRK